MSTGMAVAVGIDLLGSMAPAAYESTGRACGHAARVSAARASAGSASVSDL
jgi:hypothetical protein